MLLPKENHSFGSKCENFMVVMMKKIGVFLVGLLFLISFVEAARQGIRLRQNIWYFTDKKQFIQELFWMPNLNLELECIVYMYWRSKGVAISFWLTLKSELNNSLTNKNYYVVRNAGCAHFRNTWKLTPIFNGRYAVLEILC